MCNRIVLILIGIKSAHNIYDRMNQIREKIRILSISQGKCNNSDLGKAIF